MYKYPYGDSQQLNLDWILAKLKELEESGGAGGGTDLEEVSNALISLTYNTSSSYRRYDYAFLNGKLYRCLTDTTGAFDPAAWMEVRIGEDIPVLTRLLNADDAAITTLQNQMDSLRPTLLVNSISDLSTSLNRFVTFSSAINMAGITFPQYAKGVLVSQGGSDATLYAISLDGKLYTAFRNNGTWVNGKCINNEINDLNGAISAIQFVSFDSTSITTQVDALPNAGHFSGTVPGNTVGMPTNGAGNVEVFSYSASQKRIYFYPNGSDDECYMLEKRTSWRSWITIPNSSKINTIENDIDNVETALTPTPVTITSSSEYVTINSQQVYKMGRLVVVAMGIIINQAFNASTELLSGFPAPSAITEFCTIRSNKSNPAIAASAQGCNIRTNGKLFCDGEIATGNWYVNVTYITST